MIPTVKPPLLVEGCNASDTKAPSLDNPVHELCNLLFSIKAKTAAITIEALHHVRELAGSACALLQEHHNGPWLDDISRQIEVIKTLLVTPNLSQPPLKLSYAATLTKGIMSSAPPPPAPPQPSQPLPAR